MFLFFLNFHRDYLDPRKCILACSKALGPRIVVSRVPLLNLLWGSVAT